jgi:hypothetical protein
MPPGPDRQGKTSKTRGGALRHSHIRHLPELEDAEAALNHLASAPAP